MMDATLNFSHECRECTAKVVYDGKDPFYFWVSLADPELSRIFIDDLSFYKPEGRLIPVDSTLRQRDPILFDEILAALEILVDK